MKIDYRKLKLADGWYCIKERTVVNRSDNYCPAPIGSTLYSKSDAKSYVSIDKEDNVSMVHCDDVVAWMEPEHE